jgi:uncharacterized protein (TIGR00725 family)
VPRPGPTIAVIGPGRDASGAELAQAEEAGASIAAAGATLVCGGLGGVMEAACRGARSRGGLTVGLLPGTDREDANGWVVLALPTGLGEARNALIVRAADAVVAIGGGWGTLSEIAFALRAGVPVLGVGTWELARGGAPVAGVRAVDDAATAVSEALRTRRRIGTKPG